jgi:Domain of unknown function (DUF4041)/Meiotically up-regulated gene 113
MLIPSIIAITATVTAMLLAFALLNSKHKVVEREGQVEEAQRRTAKIRQQCELDLEKERQLAASKFKTFSDEMEKQQYELKELLAFAKSKMIPEEQLKEAQARIAEIRQQCELDLEKERQLAASKLKALDDEMEKRQNELNELLIELGNAQGQQELIDIGFSRQDFTFEDPASYQSAIEEVENEQSQMLKSGLAAKCNLNWSIEGSEKKGEQMIGKWMKLALRTFNADSDAAIAKVKWNNFTSMSDRIRKSEETIEKTLDKWGIIIVDSYRDLKLKELRLTFERAEVEQRVKEEQKEIREQMREEEKARREAESAEREAEKKERQLALALDKAKKEMSQAHTADMTKHLMRIKELEIQLATAGDQRQRAISMAQLTKMGHVYIASNVGSFGNGVLKIGMTRRMDPMDRIWELSDASVPFDFDVHGMIKSEDARGLEAMLHKKFEAYRLNLINLRKEFFRVTIRDIQDVVTTLGLDVRLTLAAEARELLETDAIRAQDGKTIVQK